MNPPGTRIVDRDRRLLEVLDRGFDRVRVRAGEHLPCAEGCSDCCYGPFPITRLDAWRLRRGLAAAGPEVRATVTADARAALATLREGYPGDAASGRLSAQESELDAFFERHAALPCPVLDRATGACRLWIHRPVACRTYGPPLAFGLRKPDHCKLCFTRADPSTVEACRWRPDPDGLEQAALRELGVEAGDDWETLIAWAVLETEPR